MLPTTFSVVVAFTILNLILRNPLNSQTTESLIKFQKGTSKPPFNRDYHFFHSIGYYIDRR